MKKERIEYLQQSGLITNDEYDSLLRKYKYSSTSQSTLSTLTLISAIFSMVIVTTFKFNNQAVTFINDEDIRNWVSAFFTLFSVVSYFYARKTVNDSESITAAYIGIGISAPLAIMFLLFLIGQMFTG